MQVYALAGRIEDNFLNLGSSNAGILAIVFWPLQRSESCFSFRVVMTGYFTNVTGNSSLSERLVCKAGAMKCLQGGGIPESRPGKPQSTKSL